MDAQYYKERLGFEPVNGNRNGHAPNGQHKLGNTSDNNEGYEENLSKIKDERDAIQKKTFTKWVNKHLKKCGRLVRNLFVDLRDGKSLLGLLEVLSEERLPSQKGQLRFHQLQNVQVALDFLRFRKIKLVNIRAEDIVDGNPKLTLGLIWTIILHFQISDIVDGDDTVNVREALLRWAQKTTERYPDVKVSNFTSSWRDGLAFSAIIHRNRPDLIDWREVQQKTVQSRLDQAFHVVEQEYGVTRLLDPEDVDTNEPDEKSLITYVSSLYDIFPDPPTSHPLYDAAAEKSLDEYRQSARRLHEWIRKETSRWQQQSVSGSSTAELRQSLKESERFRSQQLPPKHDEKQRLVQQYMQLERSFHDVGKMNLEPELHVSLLERNWSQLVSIHQQFHRHCEDELNKQERLQKLADKIQHEIRTADRRLDTIKEHVDEEAHRVTKSRPRDVKQQCEKIDTELVRVEETIKVLFSDVSTLQEGRHPQAPALHRDVQQLHTKWMSVHSHMQDVLIAPLSKRLNENPDDMLKRLIESDENFRFLSECLDWVKEKLVHIHEAEYGHDLHSCQEELELHHKEHKIIDQFQVNLDRCVTARKEYDDDELTLYMRLLSQLQKSYADLLSSSNKRLSDLMILHDFVQGATAELIWLNEKEEVEVGRDWSNRNQDLRQVDAHYEQLMSELERRERQFTAVQEQGMSLISQQHPASKTVEAYMGAMQTQWSWLLQLTLCLETHLKHAQMASQLFQDVDAMSHTIKQQDERLNGEFSVSEFTLDEGEQLLREMQELRDVMAQQGDVIQQLETRANQVTPQKQRRQATPTGQKVTAVCNYKNNNVSVRKQDECTLLDNSSPDRWTVRTPAGVEAAVPSVCFLLPPPDREALEAVEQLKRQYEMSVTLWQRKQLRMRQNMIFATIKVVKGWDLQQFVAMGSEQRDAIRRALNEDAEKLIREGDPNDGHLRRLRREIDEVNRLFDEFERLAAEANPTNQFHTKIAALETEFEKAEGELKELCVAPIPREISETERLIRNHKDWQNRLQRHESTLEEVQSIYDSLSKKTPTMQSKLEKVIGKWDSLWTTSHSYIERLKSVEATLGGLEETQTVVSRLETRLNDYRQLPDDKDGLKSAHLELVDLQNSLHKTQAMVEQLNDDALKVRKLTERTRPRQRNHADVERLEEDVSRVTKRFANCCQQVVDRLRAVDQAADLLSQYEQKEMMNRQWALQMEADAERARKAVVEKYRQCGTSIAKLLTWIAEVERRLANQEQVQEDVSSLRNQINVVKAIKDELKDEQRTVSSALDQVQDVVEKGNDILSKDEIKQLQTNAQELRQRYDTVSDHTDVLLRRLSLCLDELNKYKTDLHTFQSWLSIAERTLSEKERHMADLSKLKASEQGCREFVNDVIAHQADLRFITVAAQRFIDESKSFLKTLNDVRTNLPQRLRHIEPHKYNVKLEVDQVTKVFQSLLARGNQLLDRLTALAGRQRDYEEALERAARWMRDIEPRAQKLLEEPVASEPRQVQEQLSRARLLSTDLLSNGKLLEAAGASAEQLVRQLSEGGHQLSSRQQQQIQRPPAELSERHGRLRDAVDARCQALDAALVQSQGVHDSLDSLNSWLQEAEARLKALQKPASLVRQRLSEQQHEQRLLQADIDQHRSSVDKLRSAAAQMTPGGGRHGGVGSNLQDAAARFDRLQAACKDRGRFMQELASQVDDFWTRAEGVQHWLLQQIELIDSQEVGMLNGDAYQRRIEEVGGQRDAKKSELQAVVGAGNGLVSKKDTTDSSTTRDKVKELEGLWRELEEVLGERLREGRTRSDSLSAYERMKEEVLRWLQRMELRIDGLEPVAVDMAILKRQGDEIKPLLKEHDSFAASIDKFNELGVQYDSLLHGDRVDGPSRRRVSVTPKRSMSHGRRSVTSTLSPARKGSQERRGGSPGGSPFTTRRDSDAYTKLDDVSQIQNQLNEVSHRYELAGARLTDRQRDIDAVADELRRQLDQLRQLQQLLDKSGWREQLPVTRDEADRQLRTVRQQLEDFMYEKQPLMDGLRAQTVELLRRHPGAPGAEALQKTVDELSQRWKQRLDQLKTAQQTVQDCREFFDLHEQLGGWLQAKEKMFAVLGPLSSDPRLVHMQSQQVAVLRDEFANQHPTLQALNRCGKTVVTAAARDDPAAKKVEEKVRKTNDKWEELMAMLEDREQNLDAASGASRQFNESFSKLQRDLMRLGDAFDDMATDRLDPHKKLQLLDDLQKQLDQLRPRLSELEALGEELCLVLTDPAAKTEVKDKLYQLGRQYNQLAKKMDYLRAELDSSLKEDQEFENSCADVQDWMKACFNQLAKPLKVSADRTKLTRQLNEYEPFYKSIMAREHEVFLLQRKGSDLLAKTPNKQESKELEKFLDHLQKNWEALKQDAVGRLTQLQTCMDLCKKYHSTYDHFLPWLKKAEDKLQKLPAVSFKKADIQKQVRDLQTFRNEVSLHSSEYEQTVGTGDSLLQATDLDKTEVQSDLQKLRQRWEALGSGLTTRHQALDDVLARVADFNDGLQDLEHALQRCEDKLTSQDGSRDPRALERCDELLGEADKLTGQLQRLRKQADDLCGDARRMGSNADHLRDEVDRAGKRLNKFKDRLDSRHAELSGASQAVGEMNERVKRLYSKLAELEEELDGMGPVARTVKIVEKQVTEITYFMEKVELEKDELDQAERSVDNLAREGFTQDDRTLRNQLGSMRRQLSRIDDRGQNRQREVNLVLTKLTTFYRTYELVIDDIEQVSRDEADFPPLGSDVTTIRRQQQQFKEFKSSRVETLSVRVDDCNRSGQGLIQSASTGVTTAVLEGDLESMNQLWNELQERIHNRERALDVGLLQSGKFREALEGLLQWLADTEDMVAHQKPASADYKVVKAQVQEQKFLRKLLLDRQGSVSSLAEMGREIAANCSPAERADIDGQLTELIDRFDALNGQADERMRQLEDAMKVAKEYQDMNGPLVEWLEKMEKRLKDMEIVPTDEEKIQKRIKEHEALHDGIVGRRGEFDQLADVATVLMDLVGDDEAAALADRLQQVTDRYQKLVADSDALARLLRDAGHQLRTLVLNYEDFLVWMDEMEQRLNKYRVLSVHVDKLHEQMEELTDLSEEVDHHRGAEQDLQDVGAELMKHITNEEALQLKDKLDSVSHRYSDLETKAASLLKNAQEVLPLVHSFHSAHNKLSDWLVTAEQTLQSADSMPNIDETMEHLMQEVQDYRPVVERLNQVGPQLCQVSPGEGAQTIEGLLVRDNRRYESIVEQVQRKSERLRLAKLKNSEVLHDIDDLLDWFKEVETQVREADPPSSDPEVIRIQLKEHKALNDDVASQKGRVRDVLSSAKRLIRDAGHQDDVSDIREKSDDLKDVVDSVSKLSSDRLSRLEQALPLAEHFFEAHHQLTEWLDEAESEAMRADLPALRADQILRQQERNKALLQGLQEHKPLLDKLNKTSAALVRLCSSDEAVKVSEITEMDNVRYNALRTSLRERQQALEEALQECSQFSDKLDSMLTALKDTADQVNKAEPISVHPDRIQDQMAENNAIIDDLEKRESALKAVRKAADDVIHKAGDSSDPAVRDIKNKLDSLNKLWNHLQKATDDRSRSLDEALAIAEKFWSELHSVMKALKDLQDTLTGQEPPAVEPDVIKDQQKELQEIRHEIDQTKPEVEQVRRTGQHLMKVCGEPEKPEVRKNLADLGSAWDNITALYARREENLIDAMEKAMEFHDTMQRLLEFLESAEQRLDRLGPIGSDIDAVKKQIKQLMDFKNEVDPQMVKVETLNRQAHELMERTSPDQAAALRRPISEVNTRWDDLLKGLVERQRELDQALLRLGQFQHALDELLVWIGRTDKTLDSLKPNFGDPQVIEVELAKLKVTVNDMQAHQTSVDTLNDAGRQLIEADRDSVDAGTTHRKLNELNEHWQQLQEKAVGKQQALEKVLRDAHDFMTEIQDLLFWLNDLDGALTTSKPVGGLPETAKEQLERFMELFTELEDNRSKVNAVLSQGDVYLKSAKEGACTNMKHNLKTLKQRWDHVMNRANDKKIKLEIALKEATEFQDTLEQFIEWLNSAEKTLSAMQPVSRIMDTVIQQIDEHKDFQKAVSAHRECMLNLEKKGNHLKYFSQKQDVILIKNMLVSVQHRWERVVSKSADRTRALDVGYKEAKEFDDSWSELCGWLDEALHSLDDTEQSMSNNPDKVRVLLEKHKEFQGALGSRQSNYDGVMKLGRLLIKEKAPKVEEPQLREMLDTLKDKWNSCCNKSVARQRKLEEALLFSGQFKEALAALLDWLRRAHSDLKDDVPVHGDLDTVSALCEHQKAFEQELEARVQQVESVQKTGAELARKADKRDSDAINVQVSELTDLWTSVVGLSDQRGGRLKSALRDAERLHKAVHMLLEWLSDAEMRLRFVGALPESEDAALQQVEEHARFMQELSAKETDKDSTLDLAGEILSKAHPDAVPVIRHWQTIIQSRWEEVSSWALQRQARLDDHVAGLKDLQQLLDELVRWVRVREQKLVDLEPVPLPDDLPSIELLVQEHQEFMEDLQSRQNEVDRICRPKHRSMRKSSRPKSQSSPDREMTPGKRSGETPDGDPQREYDKPWLSNVRATSPGRERSPDSQWPRIGPVFSDMPAPGAGSRKGSRMSVSEPLGKSPLHRELWDAWRSAWMLAWERQRRLQDKLSYARELDKLQNFDFEEWRKRFMKYANQKKLRITDLFRRMDTDNDGFLEKFEFSDGIIKTNFPTSKLEMQMVADLVDRNQDGLIDYNEFMSALKPDWEKNRPLTDAEKIDDEVQKACAACTCRSKFKVFQVGEGKYRFGDSQKLRLVRILRSTVMVRVGGGWEALDEFLVKNDPCRAKGRTNVELREQFILAPGVSQSMAHFKSKRDASSPASRSTSVPTAGPITKVREKTGRSIPLSRASVSGGGDYGSSNEGRSTGGGGGFSLRKGSTPARSSSSQGGSRPPSRAGSEISLDSVDGRPTPGYQQRNASGSSRLPTYRKGSTTPRGLATTPVSLSGRSPSSDGFSMQRRMPRRPASVTAMSSGTTAASRSRIPLLTRADTSDSIQPPSSRATTPAGRPRLHRTSSTQSIPASLNNTRRVREPSSSKIVRRSSGAADTARGQARKSATTERPRWH